MKNRALIDCIVRLLMVYKELAKRNNPQKDLDSIRYLIGQAIRQYDIPSGNYHISQGAYNRWKNISKDKINDYYYRKKVICNNLSKPVTFNLYNGSFRVGKERQLSYGSTFIFREMFHEDHVIPVSMIITEMTRMPNATSSSVKALLDTMHLCILLKDEDRLLGRTAGRTLSFDDTIQSVYNTRGIYLQS